MSTQAHIETVFRFRQARASFETTLTEMFANLIDTVEDQNSNSVSNSRLSPSPSSSLSTPSRDDTSVYTTGTDDDTSPSDDKNTKSGLRSRNAEISKTHYKIGKRFDTLRLKCIANKCAQMFEKKDQMLKHLKTAHGIRAHWCLQSDCGKSFFTTDQLSDHLKSDHSHEQSWICGTCAKVFPRYNLLYRHIHWTHHEGEFRCLTSGCKHIAQTRGGFYAHTKQDHQLFACKEPSCRQTFRQEGNLMRHLRRHYNMKPYSCRYAGCAYQSKFRSTAINHIRTRHFGLPRTVREQELLNIVSDRDPRMYLGVDKKMLSKINEIPRQFLREASNDIDDDDDYIDVNEDDD